MTPPIEGAWEAPRRTWTWLILAWLVVVIAIGLWLATTTTLRQQLMVLQFWWLEATVIAAGALFVAVSRELRFDIRRRDRIVAASLAALALVLTLGVAPRTNRIYYDEQIYQGIGRNLADVKRAQMCNDGTVEYGRLQCWSSEYNKQPYAYPHLLSLAYRVFGVSESAAFGVNAGVMAATVMVVYFLTLLLFDNRLAAGFAGLIVALIPQQLLWSATTSAEPSASLACAAALAATIQFLRSRSHAALAFAAVAAVYAVQFRPESALVAVPIGVALWRHAREECGRPRLWWAGLAALALAAVHIGHLYEVRNESWGANEARLSLRYVADNLRVNGRFFLGDERFPVVVTALAVAGLAAGRQTFSRRPLAAYFLVFFGIDLLFYAGSFNYGADVRYSLMTYPPIAVLAGLGAASVADWLRRLVPWSAAAVAAGLLFQFLWYAPLVRATTEEAWAARADVGFARSVAADLRQDSYVLTHNPSMFHAWGVNAGQMSLVIANPSYLAYLEGRYRGGVYLHWNFWCNVADPAQQDVCRLARALAPTSALRSHEERDQRYAFYRFDTTKQAPAARAPDGSDAAVPPPVPPSIP